MARLSYDRVKRTLNSRLGLVDPKYILERVDNRVVGDVISATFKGKGDYERQVMIMDALEAEFGPDARKKVGLFLAYTPDEWNLGADDSGRFTRKKKVG